MNCNEALRNELIRFLKGNEFGTSIPMVFVVQHLSEFIIAHDLSCSQTDIHATIQECLDDWIINKVIDNALPELEEKLRLPPGENTWHLKLFTSEEAECYLSLSEEQKALLRLLREQNDSGHLGEMPVDVAVQRLTEMGFSKDIKYLGAEDIIYEFHTFRNGEEMRVYQIVPEFMKSPEYKKSLNEQSRWLDLKMHLWDQYEAEDKERYQRKLAKKKAKKKKG